MSEEFSLQLLLMCETLGRGKSSADMLTRFSSYVITQNLADPISVERNCQITRFLNKYWSDVPTIGVQLWPRRVLYEPHGGVVRTGVLGVRSGERQLHASKTYRCVATLASKPENQPNTNENSYTTVVFSGLYHVACASGGNVSLYTYGQVHPGALRLIHTIPGESDITGLSFNTKGTQLAIGRESNSLNAVEVWDMDVWGVEPVWGSGILDAADPSFVAQVQFSSCGSWLGASFWTGNEIKIWDACTGLNMRTITEVDGVGAFSWSPDGARIVTGTSEGSVKVWIVTTGTLEMETEQYGVPGGAGEDTRVGAVAFSPDGKTLASSHYTGRVQLWGWDGTLQMRGQLNLNRYTTGNGRRMAPSSVLVNMSNRHPDDSYHCPTLHFNNLELVTGHGSGKIVIWDMSLKQPQPKAGFIRHTERVLSVVFNENATLLASRSDDGTVKIWDLTGLEVGVSGLLDQVGQDDEDSDEDDEEDDEDSDADWLRNMINDEEYF